MLYFKNEQEKKLFSQMMARYDKKYDKANCSLSEWRGAHGYHSTLVNQTVHGTRDSLAYAYQLLNRDEAGDRARVEAILKRILPLQDTDTANKTYGIWAYYTEEPLTQMAPPDWNWADFCGKEIMQMLIEHPEKLPETLIPAMRTALLHACNSIRIRDMGPGYTNISLMGTYVTMVGGTLLGDQSLVDYAKKRLKELHMFNLSNGAYKEYNSPTYTMILASDLARMQKSVTDSEALALLDELNDLAWKTIATHYHFHTKQWAGPHARAYTMLQNKELRLQIQRALDYRIELVPLTEAGLGELIPMDFFSVNLTCPQKFLHHFTQPNEETEINLAFYETDIATAYLTEEYTIGNFYQCTFWNQKRNMLCYYGDEANPRYVGLKLLHDMYDYSSGVIVTAQKKNRCASLINFITDGGDTHCNLDMVKNATIQASDLRIRFEFGGSIADMKIVEKESGLFHITDGKMQMQITVPYVRFGEYEVAFEIGSEADHVNETGGHAYKAPIQYLDIVLYHGKETTLNFKELGESVCALTFELTDGTLSGVPISVEKDNEQLIVTNGNIQVRGCCHSVENQIFYDTFTAWIDGKEYREIYCK